MNTFEAVEKVLAFHHSTTRSPMPLRTLLRRTAMAREDLEELVKAWPAGYKMFRVGGREFLEANSAKGVSAVSAVDLERRRAEFESARGLQGCHQGARAQVPSSQPAQVPADGQQGAQVPARGQQVPAARDGQPAHHGQQLPTARGQQVPTPELPTGKQVPEVPTLGQPRVAVPTAARVGPAAKPRREPLVRPSKALGLRRPCQPLKNVTYEQLLQRVLAKQTAADARKQQAAQHREQWLRSQMAPVQAVLKCLGALAQNYSFSEVVRRVGDSMKCALSGEEIGMVLGLMAAEGSVRIVEGAGVKCVVLA